MIEVREVLRGWLCGVGLRVVAAQARQEAYRDSQVEIHNDIVAEVTAQTGKIAALTDKRASEIVAFTEKKSEEIVAFTEKRAGEIAGAAVKGLELAIVSKEADEAKAQLAKRDDQRFRWMEMGVGKVIGIAAFVFVGLISIIVYLGHLAHLF